MKPRVALVGGGIGSLLSASILVEAGFFVSIIEKESSMGGLLRSWQSPDGYQFDYGTHILAKTGISEVDHHLFGWLDWDDWNIFDALKAGNYFSGRLNDISPFIDSRQIGRELHDRGLVELLESGDEAAETLPNFLINRFGRTFFENIFRPCLEKLYFAPVEDLALDAHQLFGLTRLLVGTPSLSEQLKEQTQWDDKIAFHGFKESKAMNFYPKMGGVGLWASEMTDRLRSQGVRVLLGQQIEKICVERRQVRQIVFKNKDTISFDHLIWSLPAAYFHHLLGRDTRQTAPRLLTSRLFHFVFDSPFKTDLHYLNCFEPTMKSFRVTLYPNLQSLPVSSNQKAFRLTVEVLDKDLNEKPFLRDEIYEELVAMGIVSREANILNAYEHILPNTFPVRSKNFVKSNEALASQLQSEIENIILIGKAQAKVFFMNEVLLDSFQKSKDLAALYGMIGPRGPIKESLKLQKSMS